MADGIRKIIAYYIEYQEDTGALPVPINEQQVAVQNYIQHKNNENIPNPSPYSGQAVITWEVVGEFGESFDKKQKKFPALEEALEECQRTGAQLVIPQLQNMTRSEVFAETLLKAKIDFVCLDQPLVNRATMPAIVENFKQMRMMHSARIRRGLEQTMSKLGNPNALKEITKVNKPKTENAVMFALMLAPIVFHYRGLGYSQRKMVEALNEDGFSAPEGGHWVLSQLQKVLERIELNTLALNLAEHFEDFEKKSYTEEQQLKALIAMNVAPPNKTGWDMEGLHKVKERLEMVREIMAFNRFMLDVFPQMAEYESSGLSDEEIANKLNNDGIALPERVLWEIQHEKVEIDADKEHHWDAADIELTRNVAERRKHDIDHFVNKDTLDKAIELINCDEKKS